MIEGLNAESESESPFTNQVSEREDWWDFRLKEVIAHPLMLFMGEIFFKCDIKGR